MTTPTGGAEKVVAELRVRATRLERTFKLAPPLTLVEADLMRNAAALIESLRATIERVERERDEARGYASLGCDAAAGGAHTVIKQGSYQFCGACGMTIKNHPLAERARAAEARVTALEAEKAERNEALDGIYTYCNDTLSGRVDGGPDDRGWQREAVIRARNLARPFARPEIEAAIRAQALSRSTEVKNDEAQ